MHSLVQMYFVIAYNESTAVAFIFWGIYTELP